MSTALPTRLTKSGQPQRWHLSGLPCGRPKWNAQTTPDARLVTCIPCLQAAYAEAQRKLAAIEARERVVARESIEETLARVR